MNDELRGMHDEPIVSNIDELLDHAHSEASFDLSRARNSPLWPQAVAFLAGYFSPEVILQIRQVVESKSPDWPAGYHTFWGMGVRNGLREAGFGEAELGVRNLDNVYVELVEEAIRPAVKRPGFWRRGGRALAEFGGQVLAGYLRGGRR